MDKYSTAVHSVSGRAHLAVLGSVLLGQQVPQALAHEADDDGVRHAGDDVDGAQRAQRVRAADLKERDRDGALGERPEDALEDGRVRVAVRGEAVDDEGPRVGGGDKVEDERDDGDDPVKAACVREASVE